MHTPEPSPSKSRVSFRVYISVGFGVPLLALSTFYGQDWYRNIRHKHGEIPLCTNIGEQRPLTLTDGTWVSLDGGTCLQVSTSQGRMEIHLIKGKALFDVKHDPTRRLRVTAPNAVIEHIGTQFEVSVSEQQTAVAVLEGAVRVVGDGKPDDLFYVESGRIARVSAEGFVSVEIPKHGRGAERAVDGASLSDSISLPALTYEFAEGTDTRFVVEGEARQVQVVRALLRNRDPQQLEDLLRRNRDLTVTRHGNIVVIRMKGEALPPS